MNEPLAHAHRLVRFGVFEVDLHAGELRKSGARLNLQQQPLQVLSVLLERPGEIVSREELHRRLWADDTFVDFDHGLNTAVKRLRDTLGDTADSPRFVETVPRRGYRFIAPTSVSDGTANGGFTQSGAIGVPRARRRWLLLAAGLVVGIASLWGYVAGVHRAPTINPLSVTPFTTLTGREIRPTFSRAGTEIAFAWSPEGLQDQFDLYVKAIGSEGRLQLTNRPANFIVPAWSPDGTVIAFARMARDGSAIYVVSPLGGPWRKLVDVEYDDITPRLSWSHDGRLLAFSDQNRVFVVDLTTLERRPWDNPTAGCLLSAFPAFSPDGRWLAVNCVASYGVNDLFVQPVSGGAGHQIARVQGHPSGVTLLWSADSQHVIFAADGDLWRVAVTGGPLEKLLAGRNIEMPAISHDGLHLAYTTGSENLNLWQVALSAPGHAAGPATKLISSSRTQSRPAFSPDGRRVAFESTRSGPQEIWVTDADGSNAVALTVLGGVTGSPAWSPNGDSIAFDSRAGGSSNIYIVSSDGGPARPLGTELRESAEPAWSIDGRWIYFGAMAEGFRRLFKIPAQGGRAIRLTAGPGSAPHVARFDERIYYNRGGEIWSVSAAGNDERRLSGMPLLPAEFSGTWVLTGEGIYFVDGNLPRAGIDFLEFRTGRINRVVDLTGRPAAYAGALAFSANRLLYPQIDGLTSDIMLVDRR